MTDNQGFTVVSKWGDDRYPEHAKLHAIADHSQAIGEFIEWLAPSGIGLCDTPVYSNGAYVPTLRTTTDLLAEYFGIDQRKIEDEKRVMLDQLRTDRAEDQRR